jgi:hypothetical protein
VSRGPGSRLLAEFSSDTATCSSVTDLASLLRWALALSHISCLWPLPPREKSSGAAMCSSAPELASLPRWAPMLPHGSGLASPRGELLRCHVFSMWAPVLPRGPGLASSRGELRCFRVFLSSGPRLPAEVGSNAATCHMTPSSASSRGERQCYHVPHGPSGLWTT